MRGTANTGIQRVARRLGAEMQKLTTSDGARFAVVEVKENLELIFRSESELSADVEDADLLLSESNMANSVTRFLHKAWKALESNKSINRILKSHVVFRFAVTLGRLLNSGVTFKSRRRYPSISYHLIVDAYWNHPLSLKMARKLKKTGTRIGFVCHDILPVEHPNFFEAHLAKTFRLKLDEMLRLADDVFCVSEATRQSLTKYMQLSKKQVTAHVFKLGSDFAPSKNTQITSGRNPNKLLVLGTIEPRKNHKLVLDWFNEIGHTDYELHFIGKPGWHHHEILSQIEATRMSKNNFFWHQHVSDEMLKFHLATSGIGIVPSIAEGFGLPIVEMLQSGMRVCASDIEVFREVGRDRITYFSTTSVDSLHDAIRTSSGNENAFANSTHELETWEDSANQVWLRILETF